MNRSRLFCRLLYLKNLGGNLGNLPYVLNILTPGAAAIVATSWDQQAIDAAAQTNNQLTLPTHTVAKNAMESACQQLHTGNTSCQVYFAHTDAAKLSSTIAGRAAIAPHREMTQADKANLQQAHGDAAALPKSPHYKAVLAGHQNTNRQFANARTGLHL